QKGGGNYIPDGVDFALFDVTVGDTILARENVAEVGSALGLTVAPVIGYGTLHAAIDAARHGFRSQWGDFTAEGLSMRPRVELRPRRGDRIIAKVKHKDFRP